MAARLLVLGWREEAEKKNDRRKVAMRSGKIRRAFLG